ncbi:MAG: hypothetical protein J6Y59_09150 [Bacteroidaceae bacterium]|nr:hypothetical protein [Bacteroidaceae bacterium]
MSSITQSQITFNNINADTVYKRGGKYTHGSNANGNKFDTTLTGEELTPSFNAIAIDWNGADLSSASSSFANAADTAPVSTITTAGELTKEFYSPMFAKAA